jgi:hypothetical protein
MRATVLLAIISFAVFISGCPMQSENVTGAQPESLGNSSTVRQPVLVELFTSEGCSSCPPADKNLTFLERQQPVAKADVITLAFHVDYWDRLGWKDRFSSPLYSRRQEIYSQALKIGSNYTPQMVVDGREEFVGSDSGKASKEITKAVDTPKATVGVGIDGRKATLKVSNVPTHDDATIFAAVAEDAISSRVEGGENSGMTLEHVSVVRELKTLGVLQSDKSDFEIVFDVPSNPEWDPKNLRVVVFVQENDSRKVIGVGRGRATP